jgi:predicted MFS family arabinose efflux permease
MASISGSTPGHRLRHAHLLPASQPAGEARFLAKEEKSWLIAELAREEHSKTTGHSISALRALTHPRVWHLAAVLLGFDIGLYAMSFYMPQVVKALSNGFSSTVVGILVMVPHLAGLAAMVLVSRSSDRRLERRYHSAIPIAVAGIALVLLGARIPKHCPSCFGHLLPWESTASLVRFSRCQASSSRDSQPQPASL